MFVTLSALLVMAYALPGVAKLGSHPKMRSSADHFGIPWSRYRLIGVAELLAAAGVLVGLIWVPIGIAAASGMTVLLVGALVVHQRSDDHPREMVPVVAVLGISLAYLVVALTR